jgi:glycosyltransferase involved in cell wall biosynthesis
MRVILVADNASARFGGEAFIPFNYFRLLLKRNIDVTLVVHARNRSELVERFPQNLDRLQFVEDIWLHKALFRFGTYLPRRLADATTGLLLHLITQWVQKRIIRELSKQTSVDVIHQPIPVSPKAPSQFFSLGAPVIIGPLNGGMNYPPAFEKERGAVARPAMALGRGISNLLNFLIPGKRLASLILVANKRTSNALPVGIRGHVVELVENGVDLSIWQRKVPKATTSSETRLIFVGRLIDWKALEIVLEAIARARAHRTVSFEVIGEGPMSQAWQDLSKRLGLETLVRFSGFLSQPECARRLQEADVFVLPSLFECGGAVVLEAMAVGLPVIATAWGGPLDYLDDNCGILVEPSSREDLIEGFANAMIRLGGSSALREQMGQAGHERARQYFDWERKVDRILELYASAR